MSFSLCALRAPAKPRDGAGPVHGTGAREEKLRAKGCPVQRLQNREGDLGIQVFEWNGGRHRKIKTKFPDGIDHLFAFLYIKTASIYE